MSKKLIKVISQSNETLVLRLLETNEVFSHFRLEVTGFVALVRIKQEREGLTFYEILVVEKKENLGLNFSEKIKNL